MKIYTDAEKQKIKDLIDAFVKIKRFVFTGDEANMLSGLKSNGICRAISLAYEDYAISEWQAKQARKIINEVLGEDVWLYDTIYKLNPQFGEIEDGYSILIADMQIYRHQFIDQMINDWSELIK